MSRDVPDSSVVSWESSGWTGNRNVTQMLEFLTARGEVAVAGRVGRRRLWDLPERVYLPEDVRFTRAMTQSVQAELEDLASWRGVETVDFGRVNGDDGADVAGQERTPSSSSDARSSAASR
jgi:uncharacterized protein YcaQ